jgi:hypothetical protein
MKIVFTIILAVFNLVPLGFLIFAISTSVANYISHEDEHDIFYIGLPCFGLTLAILSINYLALKREHWRYGTIIIGMIGIAIVALFIYRVLTLEVYA